MGHPERAVNRQTLTRCSVLMTQELSEAIVKVMRQGGNRDFLSGRAIEQRVLGLSSQPFIPYNYQDIYRRLNGEKNKEPRFLSRGERATQEYIVKKDLPCKKCGKQDGQDDFLICSKGTCRVGWHIVMSPRGSPAGSHPAPGDLVLPRVP